MIEIFWRPKFMRRTLRQWKFSFVVLLALVMSACGSTSGLINAPAVPESGLLTEPTIDPLPDRIASAIPPIDPDSFAGNWEGRDDDGSKVTLAIVQIDNRLTGIIRDWYTGFAMRPGFQANGSGATRSATSAKMTFYFLSPSDGMAVRVTASLTLSNKGSTLMFNFSGDNSTLLHRR